MDPQPEPKQPLEKRGDRPPRKQFNQDKEGEEQEQVFKREERPKGKFDKRGDRGERGERGDKERRRFNKDREPRKEKKVFSYDPDSNFRKFYINDPTFYEYVMKKEEPPFEFKIHVCLDNQDPDH